MTKGISKKLLMSLMAAIMLICILVTSIYAASEYVFIIVGEGPQQTAAITATNGAKYQGNNYTTSGVKLHIDLQSSDGSKWVTRESALMNIGSSASGYSTLSGNLLWRVQLRPYLEIRDAIGRGIVSNR